MICDSAKRENLPNGGRGSRMKFRLRQSIRLGFGIVLQAFLFSAAISSAQARSQDCDHIYSSIRSAAMYCGFFCDQDELRPLQAAYEARCIVSAIPASALGFDSSPEPPTVIESQPQPEAFLQPSPGNNQQFLKTLHTISRQQFASNSQRMLLAEAFLGYCKAALSRIAYRGPRVGLTEESGDRADATMELAQWRLSTIFGDCTEAAHEILDAKEARHEAVAWTKIAQFLEKDEAVRELGMSAEARSESHRAKREDLFATANWRTMRAAILDAAGSLRKDP
jgi:hypothetical protein